MKINKTGNQHSEILKSAQFFPNEDSASNSEGDAANDPFADKEFLKNKWHGEYQDKYTENDIIGALTHAVSNIKAADFRNALKAIDKAREMIGEIMPETDSTFYSSEKTGDDVPDLYSTHSSGEYMSKGPGEY